MKEGLTTERIEGAVELYHQETGAYPASLADLTPGYMPFILGPLTGRGLVWCYQVESIIKNRALEYAEADRRGLTGTEGNLLRQ